MALAWSEERWARLGIPACFWFSKPTDCPAVAEFTSTPKDLLVTGANGVGKSHAASILAKAWGSTWRGAQQILLDARHAFGADEKMFYDELTNVGSLIIDDLCAAQKSESATASLLYVINRRLENRKPTVITMDKSLAELHRGWDTSIASRLGGFERVALKGKDRRLRVV